MGSTPPIRLKIDGREYEVLVGDLSRSPVEVFVDGQPFLVEIGTLESNRTPAGRPSTVPPEAQAPIEAGRPPTVGPAIAVPAWGRIVAPMPGSICNIRVKPGQRVERGDVLCHLEAMKMSNAIHAPDAGVIESVAVSEGQVVAFGQLLLSYAD